MTGFQSPDQSPWHRTAALPLPTPEHCDLALSEPETNDHWLFSTVTHDNAPLLYNAYHAMMQDLGIPRAKRPLLCVEAFLEDGVETPMDNASYKTPSASKEFAELCPNGTIAVSKQNAQTCTLLELLCDIAHEAGHFLQDREGRLALDEDQMIETVLSRSPQLLLPDMVERTRNRAVDRAVERAQLHHARQNEYEADRVAARFLGAENFRLENGQKGVEGVLSQRLTQKDYAAQKIEDHPHTLLRRQAIARDAEQYKVPKLYRRDKNGGRVER